jgi:hypothetical protein
MPSRVAYSELSHFEGKLGTWWMAEDTPRRPFRPGACIAPSSSWVGLICSNRAVALDERAQIARVDAPGRSKASGGRAIEPAALKRDG